MARTYSRTSTRPTFKGKGRGGGTGGGGGGTTPTPTEPPPDTTPNAITFTPVTGAAVSTVTASNNVTPAGFDTATTLTVEDGVEYSLDNGSTWASIDTLFAPGSTLKIRHTSSANPSTPVTKGGTLGGVSFEFTVTTAAGAAPSGTLVSTLTELHTAIAAAVDGDVIRVAAGTYAYASISGKVFGTDVTIKANDAGNKPVFEGMKLSSCTHLALQNLIFQMSAAPKYGLNLASCTDITVTGCVARGTSATVFSADAHGLFIRNSQRITIDGNECKWLEFGAAHLDCDTVTFSDNDFHDCESDGIRGGGTDNLTIDGNRFYDFYPLEGHHPDGVQIWTTNVVGLTSNITITNNLVYRGAGDPIQGIFFRDQIGTGYANVTVTGNAVVGGLYHGICVAGLSPNALMTGAVVNDNFVQGFSDQSSWLRITQTTGASYANNQYSALNNATNTSLTDGGGNTLISSAAAPGDYTLLDAWLATHPNVPDRA